MKKLIPVLIFILFVTMQHGQAQIQTKDFKNPPMKYRPVPLWFWNNTAVESAKLAEQLKNMIEKDGYGGCAILPFGPNFRPLYLSDDYFTLYGEVIKEAKKYGAQMSLYDEYGFPSGSIGAINADGEPRFMNKYPDATVKRLDKYEYPSNPSEQIKISLPEGKLMAVVAMDTVSKERISLRNKIYGNELKWEVPATGTWMVMIFVSVKDGDPNVDYLDPEAVKLFIKETHDKYYEHFAEEFGKTITTTFFDEPTMYRAEGRMWTDNYNDKFVEQYGFSPDLFYPSLWYDIGEETESARNYLFGFRSHLYAKGFMKAIQEWASVHGILSTGHQDQEEIANPVSVSGDLLLCGKYMDIPGIDKIGGDRPAELYYKVVSSSAYNWDQQLVMSETYGAMGNISVDEMYHIAMEQYAKGINYLIPHAVWYNDEDVTFLPELSYRNPLYKDHLPAFNLFLSRLNYLLRPEGRHVADIAMVYPIESMQGDHYLDGPEGNYAGGVIIPKNDYVSISALLTDQLGKDFTYLHPEVINTKCIVENGILKLNNEKNKEEFRVLIVPGMKTISLENLQIIQEFYEKGGHVIFTSQLPSVSAELGKNNEVRTIIASMLKKGNSSSDGTAVFIENPTESSLRQALEINSLVYDVTFIEGKELNYIHKICGDQSVFYLANLKDKASRGEVMLKGHIVPELYDPHTGNKEKVKYEHREIEDTKVTSFILSLESNKSVFLIEK